MRVVGFLQETDDVIIRPPPNDAVKRRCGESCRLFTTGNRAGAGGSGDPVRGATPTPVLLAGVARLHLNEHVLMAAADQRPFYPAANGPHPIGTFPGSIRNVP